MITYTVKLRPALAAGRFEDIPIETCISVDGAKEALAALPRNQRYRAFIVRDSDRAKLGPDGAFCDRGLW